MSGRALSTDAASETLELRQRLEEAEETIRAIQNGEVDALVIGGTRPHEVFTLEAGPEPYRVFMEAMEIGAAALDDGGRVLYANSALCALLGCASEELQAAGLSPFLTEGSRALLADLLSPGEGGRRSVELKAVRASGERQILATAGALRLGPTAGIALTFTDITERQRLAAIEESERLARAILASAAEAVVVCDPEGRITHANGAARAIATQDPLGLPFDEALPLVLPDMTGLFAGEDLIAMAVGGAMVQGMEAAVRDPAGDRNLLVSAAPLTVTGNDIRGCVVTMVDLTQRKAAERQQLLLMRELDHRVKNTLALVASICTRTTSMEDTVEGFRKAFLGRIHALAATHTLLAEKSWSNLLVKDIVSAELAPYVAEGDARLELTGLDVWVSPRAATALGLIIHELATNAVKYGALSVVEGRITVAGELDEGGQALRIRWEEADGPPLQEPTRRGFGRTVIARSLSYAPGGGAELNFLPEGLRCVVNVPWEDVQMQPQALPAA
ncbi:HWE histidine kinase domain-containing protein [Aureimonas psammosilenae]|uniref:HWE histidine kinase domain-containing protein n=1 Tax=Aureimonas psammosilenae TaxID=2495496 RepID=UPI0012608C4F|nr:HWE histidine kinase domain-containing protein [Aureimonas psammosilenae]